jgi:hypothetical protein
LSPDLARRVKRALADDRREEPGSHVAA